MRIMGKNDSSSIIETLKRHFEVKSSKNVFSSIAPELAELYTNYHFLILSINNLKKLFPGHSLTEKLLAMEFSLRESSLGLLQIIENCIDRKISVYICMDDDNLLKIAQKSHSDIPEIMELNKLKSVYSLEAGKPILVPVRTY